MHLERHQQIAIGLYLFTTAYLFARDNFDRALEQSLVLFILLLFILFYRILAYFAGFGFPEVFAKDYSEAILHYEKAVELDPDFVGPLLSLCYVYMKIGSFSELEAILDRLSQIRGQLSFAERLHSDYLRSTVEGRRLEALQHIRRLAQADARKLEGHSDR